MQPLFFLQHSINGHISDIFIVCDNAAAVAPQSGAHKWPRSENTELGFIVVTHFSFSSANSPAVHTLGIRIGVTLDAVKKGRQTVQTE